MSQSSLKEPLSLDAVVGRVADDFLDRVNRGEQPDVEDYLRRYPEAADVLRGVLSALQLLQLPPEPAAAEDAPAPSAPVEGQLGDFRLLREIGRGGMGVVYEAEQVSLRRKVALKVLPFAATLDARQLVRFKNEAQAAAGLHHTNIVPVYSVGCDRAVHFYAMQFIEGQTLAQMIADLGLQIADLKKQPPSASESAASVRDNSPPTQDFTPEPAAKSAICNLQSAMARTPPVAAISTERMGVGPARFRRVAELGVQAAEAMDHAHQMGVVHRDIKPGNLMVDTAGRLWVTDFGLAHVQHGEANLTLTGDLVGTLRYMSPEQALAKRVPIDHRTDIYSLGATLYELLTLEPAFAGKDRQELLRQIAFEEPKAPRRLDKAIPVELETILLKTIEKNPADRYATAAELANDLRRFLEDRPIQARRPSVVQRINKLARRHRGVVWASFVGLAAAMVILAISTFVVWREKENKEEALESERRAKTLAEKRLKQIEKGVDLLSSIFRNVSPKLEEKEGKSLRVLLGERLDQVAKELEGDSIGEPLVVAKLQLALGASQLELGHTQKAIELLTQAHTIYRSRFGPDHPDTLGSMNNLATSYLIAGRTLEAVKLHEETLEIRRTNLGPHHPDTLRSMNNLANSYADAGRTREALKLHEETLRLQKAKLGADHPDTLDSMSNLANSYVDAGHTQEALNLREETLRLQKAKLGADHFDTLGTMSNLANSYADAGRMQEALKLREETLRLQKAKLGADHRDTLGTMNNLANSYADAGHNQKALKLYEETLQLMKTRRGRDHPDTLKCMGNLAESYNAVGRNPEALKLREETVQLMKTKLGPDHADTLQSMNNLAGSYIGAHQISQAAALLRQTLTLRERRAKAGPGNNTEQSFLAWTHGQMGVAEQARHDYVAAAQAYARSVEMFAKLDGAGALQDPFFRGRITLYRQRLSLCRKAAQAVKDLDFALQQPATEVPALLELRLRYLLKQQNVTAAVESAAKIKERAGDAEQLYDAACAHALCAGATNNAGADPAALAKKCAEEAMRLLKQAVAKGYKNAGHMKQDKDLDALRQRDDFKKLLAALEAAKKN